MEAQILYNIPVDIPTVGDFSGTDPTDYDSASATTVTDVIMSAAPAPLASAVAQATRGIPVRSDRTTAIPSTAREATRGVPTHRRSARDYGPGSDY